MKYKLTIDGKTYVVDLEPVESEPQRAGAAPLPGASHFHPPAAAPPPPPSGGSAVADESKVCRSPVAGVVVRVSAQVGQSIQANDELIVLEAMKMETTITSPVAGKVSKVNAAVGDSVQSQQVLVEFE